MRTLIATAAALAALAITAGPAGAITYGSPDGNGHPNVGGLVAHEAFSDGTWTYCSGTLIAPTVFLTAAHCADADGETDRVTFDPAYQDGDTVYTGTMHMDPADNQAQSDPHDIAVIVFDRAVEGIAPARLPASWLRISMNPSHGDGGTCFGDSGGPNFLGTTGIVAATTITGDSICRSTNVDYRLDTASARGFLAHYVTLP